MNMAEAGTVVDDGSWLGLIEQPFRPYRRRNGHGHMILSAALGQGTGIRTNQDHPTWSIAG
jgi:hypothetical protein